MVGAERLLAMLPGVRSACIDGDIDRATEVRLLVEEDPPLSEILEAVRATLHRDTPDFPRGAIFHIQVASTGADPRELEPKRSAEPVAASPATSENGSIRLITHQVRDVSPGVTGVDLTLGLAGHRFAGGASGKADSSGRKLVPALATLSALGSYIRFASNGGGPTLALESVSEVSLGASRVAVVVVTMSGHSAPLIASWPLTDASGPAVVRATLEAAARRVTRLSTAADHPPEGGTEPAEPSEPAGATEPAEATEPAAASESTGGAGSSGILRQQAESLLRSAEPIASARIALDRVQGFRIHILATAAKSKSEILEMVTTLLQERLGLRVRSDQITVAQSRLSREELDHILHPTASSTSAGTSAGTHAGTGDGTRADDSVAHVSRPALVDFHIVAKVGGKQEVSVRLVGGGGPFDGRREANGGGVALLRPLAEATLDAIGGLMQRGGRQVVLVLKDVRRFRRRGDNGVLVLVEAVVDGRKRLSSGVAFSLDSFERASVVAVLQATNTFLDGVASTGSHDPSPQKPSDSPAPSNSPSDSPKVSGSPEPSYSPELSDLPEASDLSEVSDSTGAPDSPGASASPRTSARPKVSVPYDYVSEVLSRIQSGTVRRPGWTQSGLPKPD